ncbi:ATP-grasp domain-containing protein [Tumebacillus sp. ITR2]|uniref:ATP-grasp domain-containing protein n=1 Tax=Tumebacillus amylolyticus TaxID=2801339 RepID=A0ABS1JFD2_9BACL|nr:ATP-grasp domain-containing protein [Tumebacillus amylolyticus]MBL0389003.1 ATP-grasp domain-containing protein [Tumebacillus amylolyticus]
MTTVLVTNGMQSKSLAVARSLGRRGNTVLVGETVRFHSAGFSKYTAKTLVYPDPKHDPEQWFNWLRETIIREKVDVLYPTDDDTLDIVVHRQEELRGLCHLPIPSLENYLIASDKGETMKLAMKAGLSCPQTFQPIFEDTVNLDVLRELAHKLEFPVVIKPRMSSGSRGIRFVQTMEELLSLYPDVHAEYPNPLLQECIPPGTKYDVCLSFDSENRLTGSFVQKQIRNYPVSRGPSTVHESVEFPEAIQEALRLMEHLPWYGVVDVEYIQDPRSGQLKLLEINPRFWSSVHLPIRCGVDFPYLLHQHALNLPVDPAYTYQLGVVGRALLPGDTLHYLSNPKRREMQPSFWDFSTPDDTLSKEDPMPTVGFLLCALGFAWNPKMWKFVISR